ncbi:hypothetical protein [Propionivibrio sp.]|uniref:hypothetical protein n=1 Tax=Propionivibrio sp. TaxID=2212460 RepID=UPI0039E456D1
MLSIGDIIPQVWVTHEDTGTRYLIQPLQPRDGQRLLQAARNKKTGEIDHVTYNGLVAEHIVRDWDGVGDKGVATPCTPEARIRFGERFGRIVGFLIEKAVDPALFSDEAEAGKNA